MPQAIIALPKGPVELPECILASLVQHMGLQQWGQPDYSWHTHTSIRGVYTKESFHLIAFAQHMVIRVTVPLHVGTSFLAIVSNNYS